MKRAYTIVLFIAFTLFLMAILSSVLVAGQTGPLIVEVEAMKKTLETPAPPPPMDPIVKENIELMINIIEVMGLKEKAAAAKEMLGNGKIIVKDLEGRYGGCFAPTGNIDLDIKDVYPWKGIGSGKQALTGISVKNNSHPRKDFLRKEYGHNIFIGAATLYHELIHCTQQPAVAMVGSGMMYRATLNDHVAELEAHGKDIIFLGKLIDNLDEVYKEKFKENITSEIRNELKEHLAKSMKESYEHFKDYKKPSWVKPLVRFERNFFFPTGVYDILELVQDDKWKSFEKDVDEAVKKSGDIMGEVIAITEPSQSEVARTITQIDTELGFLKPQEDHFIFTSIDWLAGLASIYNQIEDSAFKEFISQGLGERTNIIFLYEDGEEVIAGLNIENGEITYVYGDTLSNPTVDVIIPRLVVADLLNADNFYQASLDALQEGIIKIEHHSWWGKIKYFIYSKIILPFKKTAIVDTETEEIFPAELLQKREDLISGATKAPEIGEELEEPEEVSKTPEVVCGDGHCNVGESCSSCEVDCGKCEPTPFCGDGKITEPEVCDGTEFNQQCLDSFETNMETADPRFILTCFGDCRGCAMYLQNGERVYNITLVYHHIP